MGPPLPACRREADGDGGGARGRARRAPHRRDEDSPPRRRPGGGLSQRRPRLVRHRGAREQALPGDAQLVRGRLPRPALRRERVPGPVRPRARHRSHPRRRRLARHRGAPPARGRALGEADAAHRADAAAQALRRRARGRPQGRHHRRGRGRALRRLRHLPREQGTALLGEGAGLGDQAAPLHAAERVHREGPQALRRVPLRLLQARARGRRRPALQPPAALREHGSRAPSAGRRACSRRLRSRARAPPASRRACRTTSTGSRRSARPSTSRS